MHLTPDMEGRSTNRLCAEARASFWALHVERGSNSSGPAAPIQPVFAAREPCLTPNILCPLTPLRVSCDSHTHSVPPRASAARGACCHLSSALLPALPHPTVPWGTSLMKTRDEDGQPGAQLPSHVLHASVLPEDDGSWDEEDPQLLVPLKR